MTNEFKNYKSINVELKDNGLCVLTFNKPKTFNRWDGIMYDEEIDFFTKMHTRKDISVKIL